MVQARCLRTKHTVEQLQCMEVILRRLLAAAPASEVVPGLPVVKEAKPAVRAAKPVAKEGRLVGKEPLPVVRVGKREVKPARLGDRRAAKAVKRAVRVDKWAG